VLGDKGQGPQGGICGMVQLHHAGAFLLTRTFVRMMVIGERLGTVHTNDPMALAAQTAKAAEYPQLVLEATYGLH
jgi:hypothetical protein